MEKFLESPAEKRLRRMRVGTIVSSIGLGAALMFILLATNGSNTLHLIGAGIVTFCIGLGIILNALLFTLPKKSLTGKSTDAESQREIDSNTNELVLPEASQIFTSVTEETTRHLNKKIPTK
jgi:hypothetical protein